MSRITPEDLTEVRRLLAGHCLGGCLEHVAECGSTQDLVRARAEAGAPEGLVIVADHQTRGRGQRGNTWTQPPGKDLAFSLLLRPPPEVPPVALAALLPVGVCLGLEEACGQRLTLKWPNDVLLANRKIAGILIEASSSGGRARYVVGIGVNVNTTEFPRELTARAGSLRQALGHDLARAGLLASLLLSLDSVYRELLAGAHDVLLGILTRRLGLAGVDVDLVRGTETLRGRVQGLDLRAVRFRDEHGREHEFAPETVTRIVPATGP